MEYRGACTEKLAFKKVEITLAHSRALDIDLRQPREFTTPPVLTLSI